MWSTTKSTPKDGGQNQWRHPTGIGIAQLTLGSLVVATRPCACEEGRQHGTSMQAYTMMEVAASCILCKLCRSLFEEINTVLEEFNKLSPEEKEWKKASRKYQTFHESNTALQDSLRLGCLLCTALSTSVDFDARSFECDEVRFENRVGHIRVEFQFWANRYPHLLLSKDKRLPELPESRTFVLFKVHLDRRLFFLTRAASTASNTGDSRVLSLLEEWMGRCRDHHVQCPWTQQPSRYPTRLLDVEENVIRLVETRGRRIFGPYATLSHSWGQTRIRVLTKETLSDFRQGINYYDIPPTFRNAIDVARHLDIRYLWIDCYCILQSEDGRNEDQQQEIAEMGEIYANSVINIGADAAASPMEGCFVARTATPLIHIEFSSATNYRADEYLLYDERKLEAVYEDFGSPRRSSVFGRAWCMQERFLCARMVHFARSGVFWECDQTKFTSDLVPFTYIYSRHGLPMFSFMAKEEFRLRASSFSDQWRQILRGYTEMELSQPTEDKLAACGGIAKRIADLMGDEYIAGFFRRNLIPSLSWTGITLESRAKRAEAWRAPSWSWASMDGGLDFPGPPPEPDECATLISAECMPSDPSNPYGALDHATITLKGRVLDVFFKEIKTHSIRSFTKDKVIIQWAQCKASIQVELDDVTEATGEFVMLFTYIYMMGINFEKHDKFGQGLMLKACGRQFVRVGAFNVLKLSQEMLQALEERFVTIE